MSGAPFDAIDATWPAAEIRSIPGWRIRYGAGGGSRVSSASATAPDADIDAMAAAHAALGQVPRAMLRTDTQTALDAALARAGYRKHDPTRILTCPIERLARPPEPLTAFEVAWPPLVRQAEIWAAGGIGPARLAVMARCRVPKTALLGRSEDKPAGTAFVAVDGGDAMVHALSVLPVARRRGTARALMQAAALWARRHGALRMSVLVTEDNAAANALYDALGMTECGRYHYRAKDEDQP